MSKVSEALRVLTGVGLLSVLGACAQYGTTITGTSEDLRTGAVDAAIVSHEKAYEGTTADKRGLLYYMESGELQRARTGGLDASTQSWLQADALIRGWEDEARGNMQKTIGTLGAWLLSDSLSRYDGQDYEKVMLSTMLAENHLANGKWDTARVEIRKMYEREALIAALREKQIDALNTGAQQKGVSGSSVRLEDIKGYPVEVFNDPEVTRLRNSYQSAVSHYLAGFVFEALNEPSLAAAGYRKAIELRPDVQALRGGLEHLDNGQPSSGMTDVLILIETGIVPARDSLKVTLPVRLGSGVKLLTAAYPVIRPSPENYAPASIEVASARIPAVVVTNLDAMARRALKDDMPLMIARSLTRMAVSGATQEALQRKDKTGWGSLISLAVGAVSAATASSDTREWRTLPAYISLARTTVKSGPQTLAVDTPMGRVSAVVPVAGAHQLVVVRPLGSRLEVLASQPGDQPMQASVPEQKSVPTTIAADPAASSAKSARSMQQAARVASTSNQPTQGLVLGCIPSSACRPTIRQVADEANAPQ